MAESVLGHVDQDVAARFQLILDEEAVGTQPPDQKEDQSTSEGTDAEEASETQEGSEEEASEETPAAEETSEETVAAAPADEETEAEYIDSWDDLAASLEFDPQELLDHLQIPGRAEGETISLSEAVNQYRSGPDLDAAARAEVDSVTAGLREDSKKRFSELETLTARMIGKIERHRAPAGGWDALRDSDPSEYIRLTEAQNADRADAEAAIASLQAEAQRHESEDKKLQERIEQEQTALTYKLRPDWRDAKVGRAAFEEIQGYLKTSGFSPEQVDSLIDARSIITVWKAAQYDKSQAKKPRLLKRLRKLPAKHVKASARDETAPVAAQQKEHDAALDKFRKSGQIKDAVSLFGEHIT